MKTTIKKMIRFGLKKEDIKAEFGLNEEQFTRYKHQGRSMEIDNLPELLDKYNSDKIINNVDRERADIFDKLFRMADKEVPNLTIEQKSNMITAFPNFIEDIKIKIAEQKISQLEEQIKTIKEQINAICLENNMAVIYPTTIDERKELEVIAERLDGTKYNAFGEAIEEKPKERQKKTILLNFRDGIRPQNTKVKLGQEVGLFSIKKRILETLMVGDKVIIKTPEKSFVYEIERKTITNRASYARLRLLEQD